MPRKLAARTIEYSVQNAIDANGIAARLGLTTITFGAGPADRDPTVCTAERIPHPYKVSGGGFVLARETVDICSLDMAYPLMAVVNSRYRHAHKKRINAERVEKRKTNEATERREQLLPVASEWGERFRHHAIGRLFFGGLR